MKSGRESVWKEPSRWGLGWWSSSRRGAARLAFGALLGGCSADPNAVEQIGSTHGADGLDAGAETNLGGAGGNASVGNAAGNGAMSGNAATIDGGVPPLPQLPRCETGLAGSSQIPRLTNDQYGRTVRDLLGVTTLTAYGDQAPAALLAPNQSGELTAAGWNAYATVAEAIAVQVMADATLRTRFIACTPTGDGTECLHDTIVAFGRRAFRRPLRDDEVARFESIVAQGASITETGAPEQIAEVLLQTFLSSPSFIQRTEITQATDVEGNFVLSGYEIASRLSYMLWGTTPDETLDLAADAGALTTREQVLAQAHRMLAAPDAREVVRAFHRSLLRMGPNSRWGAIAKSSAQFPDFSAAAVPAMIEETEKFFEHIVFTEKGSFSDLLLSPVGFVNAATAPLYGLDPSTFGSELEQVALDETQRPGFLTRVGFLSAYSGAARTSPALRGAFIGNDVLGIGIPPEPETITPIIPEDPNWETNRERLAAQTAAPDCAACHQALINPLGFVMEAYDAVGAWQTVEADTGAAINTVADVYESAASGLVTVTDPAGLMKSLAASTEAERHYAKTWVRFGFAELQHPEDSCAVEQLTAQIAEGEVTLLELLADLTQTDPFLLRVLETEATP